MRKAIIAATLGSLVLAAPAAHANEWEGLAAGLAGAVITGAIVASQQPHVVFVPVHHHHVVVRRAPPRVIVIHDHAPVQASVPAGLVGDHGGL
jgi:hypothetical protein